MPDRHAETAAYVADSVRAAIALMRAFRDGRDGDVNAILNGSERQLVFGLASLLAPLAGEGYFTRELRAIGDLEVSGELERAVAEYGTKD